MTELDLPRRLRGEPGGPVQLFEMLEPWLNNLGAMLDQPDMRWPVLRSGERDTIPALTRRLVLRRDNHHCKACGAPWELQLDHVIPWSYGGTDRSDEAFDQARSQGVHG